MYKYPQYIYLTIYNHTYPQPSQLFDHCTGDFLAKALPRTEENSSSQLFLTSGIFTFAGYLRKALFHHISILTTYNHIYTSQTFTCLKPQASFEDWGFSCPENRTAPNNFSGRFNCNVPAENTFSCSTFTVWLYCTFGIWTNLQTPQSWYCFWILDRPLRPEVSRHW